MKIMITGAGGFIGENLKYELYNKDYHDLYLVERDTKSNIFEEYLLKSDFIFHLAGVNRPVNDSEYWEGNYGFSKTLVDLLRKNKKKCPIVFASSTQAALDNPYGISKKASEDELFGYANETGANIIIYRLPNVFGKWCKPNYNSAIATFCYNTAHGLPIEVHNSSFQMDLVYIDDLLEEFIKALRGHENKVDQFCEVPLVYSTTLGNIANIIDSFKTYREEQIVPDISDQLIKKLYSTYLSYLPEESFSFSLKMNSDQRGSFTEFVKTPEQGQVSVNILKPGIVKGNHWHHTKHEKFLVVSGKGVARFRKVGESKINEYFVGGEKLEVIEIPPGYTHNIENIGKTDLIVIIWANECYNPQKTDTYQMEV